MMHFLSNLCFITHPQFKSTMKMVYRPVILNHWYCGYNRKIMTNCFSRDYLLSIDGRVAVGKRHFG